MHTLRGACWLLGLLLILGAVGCKSAPKMDLSIYPNGGIRGSGGNVESIEGTLFKVRQVTPDGQRTVAEFFRNQLVQQWGWSEKPLETAYAKGTLFSDENFKGEDPKLFEFRDGDVPVDPAKPAGQVFVYETGNETRIRIWRYVPKPAK
jgi:hypothetical protein